MKPGSIITTIASFLIPGVSSSEPVTLEIQQNTSFGESVFAVANIPALGSGELTAGAKLSPNDFPIWRLPVEPPPGVTITPRFYLRNDDPNFLGSEGNGTLIQEGEPITAAGEADPMTISVPGAAEIVLESLAAEPLPKGNLSSETGRIEYPGDLTARQVRYRLSGDGAILGDNLVPTGWMTWWAYGQAFLSPPPAASPSSPREDQFTFLPSGFQARTIRVLLPRGYDENAAKSYPVLYALDGQNLFSTFTGPRFGSWDLDLTVNQLIARGEIPEIIVIGIDNTSDRFAEYIPNGDGFGNTAGRGNEFLTAIRDELIPDVEERFRARSGAENRVLLGSSLGGLLGFEACHEFQDTWATVIAMSPSMQIGTNSRVADASRTREERGRLWMDSGTGGGSNDGYWNTVTVRDALLSNGGEALGPKFMHAVGHGQDHNEAAWRSRSPDALRWAYSSFEQQLPRQGWLIF